MGEGRGCTCFVEGIRQGRVPQRGPLLIKSTMPLGMSLPVAIHSSDEKSRAGEWL